MNKTHSKNPSDKLDIQDLSKSSQVGSPKPITGNTIDELQLALGIQNAAIGHLIGLVGVSFYDAVKRNPDEIISDPVLALLTRYYIHNPQYAIDLLPPYQDIGSNLVELAKTNQQSLRRLGILIGRGSTFATRATRSTRDSKDSPLGRLAIVLRKEIDRHGALGALRRLEEIAEQESLSRGMELEDVLKKGSWGKKRRHGGESGGADDEGRHES